MNHPLQPLAEKTPEQRDAGERCSLATGSAARVSPAMVDAYDLAKANGGRLVKHRGGFWAGQTWTYLMPYASTRTVEALVKRGMAYVSANHTDAFRRTYPTEITIRPLEPNDKVEPR